MNDPLDSDPEFDAELSATMARLAARGVPDVADALPAPTPAGASPADERVDAEIVLDPGPGRRRLRERVLVVAAIVAAMGILGVLATTLGDGDGHVDTADAAGTTWTEISPSPLAARAGSASVWTGDQWFIWGGQQSSPGGVRYLSDGALYDPTTDRWQVVAPSPLAEATLSEGLLVGGEIIVGGGWAGTQDSIDAAIAAYDPATDRWRRLPDAPGPIVHLQLIDGAPTATILVDEGNALTELDMASETWSDPDPTFLSADLRPSAEVRARHAVVGDDRYYADDSALHENEFGETRFDLPDILQWRSAVATDREVIVTGQGSPSDDRSDIRTVARYDTQTGETRVFESERPHPGYATTALTDKAVVLMPGLSGAGDIELFDLATNRWVDVETPPVDVRRREPVTVSTGDQFLLWGGDTAHGGESGRLPESSGAILTIDSSFPADLVDEWREIAPSPLSSREEHVAVWTGTEMIIWGGRFQGGGTVVENGDDVGVTVDEGATPLEGFRDGAAYDPATDTWRTIADAPFGGTYRHRAVWTGTEMVIVGRGADDGSVDAAAYDPEADSWRMLLRPEVNADFEVAELIVAGSRLVLFVGGLDNDASTTVFSSDLTGGDWAPLLTLADVPRFSAAVEVEGQIHAVGVQHRGDGLVNLELRGIPDQDGTWAWYWSEFEFVPRPEQAVPVWLAADGGDLLAVAGEWGTDAVTTVFDMDADGDPFEGGNGVRTRTESAPAILPSSTFSHLADPDLVVTAAGDLLVLGGTAPSDSSVGARRSPDGDWSALPPLPRPVEFAFSGVWIGDQLIVWGGRAAENGGSSVATGAAFRPS